MKAGLGTSVVLRLLIGEPRPQAEAAWRALVEIREAGGATVVSDLVVSETYFALQHHYAVPKEQALRCLKALFDSGDLVASGSAARVLAIPRLASAKPGFVDRMIHAAYAGTLDQVLTFEKAARTLPHTRVLGI